MKQKTIVQVLDLVPDGHRSLDRFLIGLAESMNRQGWKTIFVFGGEPPETFCQRLKAIGVDYIVHLVDKQSFGVVSDLGKKLKAFAPDMIQTHFISKFDWRLFLLYIMSSAKRLVVTDHASGHLYIKHGVQKLIAQLRTRFSLLFIDRLISVSKFVHRRAVEGAFFPEDRAICILNGVDTSFFKPVPNVYPTDDGVLKLSYIGLIIEEKGLQNLLRAMTLLLDQKVPVRLSLVGEGDYVPELKRLTRELRLDEHVDFVGNELDTPRMYSQSDVVVVPSEWGEAFGFVAVEAAACRTCVAVSDAGALAGVMAADTSAPAALVFKRGDPVSIAATLKTLADQPELREKLRQRGYELVQQQYLLESTIEEYTKVLCSLPV